MQNLAYSPKQRLKGFLKKNLGREINIIRGLYNKGYNKLKKQVVSHYVLHRMQTDLASNSSIIDMLNYLNKYNSFMHSKQIVKFLSELFEFSLAEQKQTEIFTKVENKRIYILHVCVWGEDYSNKMLRFLLPSLLAPGNIPALSKLYNTLFIINCDDKTKLKLQDSPIMQELRNYLEIRYQTIPTIMFENINACEHNILTRIISFLTNIQPNWKYYLLGCLQNLAMLKAQQNKAYISFLMPDLLFSESAFSSFFAAIQDGKKAAVTTAFRSLDTKVENSIKEYYQVNHLSIQAETLTNIAVDSMHTAAQNRIVASNNYFFQLTAQLIFHYPNEIVVRALHYHPVLVDFNAIHKDVAFDYNPIDSNLLCNIVDYDKPLDQQVWVNENSNAVTMMEISRGDIEKISKAKKPVNLCHSIQNLIASSSWTSLNKYLVSKRCVYTFKNIYDYYKSDLSDISIIK